MPVLPKYQLKLLFESGDLITQSTLNDFIEASYNPTLVAGTGVNLSTVSTPSGTTITINSTGGGSGTGSYSNATAMPQSFPGVGQYANIASGTSFSNKTFTEMMNLMLYPTLNPAFQVPSAGFVLTQSGLQEIADTINLNFNATFNRGTISPAYGTNGFRSGPPTDYDYTGTSLPTTVPSASLSNPQTVTGYSVLQGANSWTSVVDYSAGQQPLNSIGSNYDAPLGPGSTSAITQTITGVFPLFGTTQTITNGNTKQGLLPMTGYATFSMVAESVFTPNDKQTADIPDAWATIVGLQQFTPPPIGPSWDPIPINSFTTSSVSRTGLDGASIPYTRYTHNGATTGARQIRFTT